ncbi:MAG: hypothetical protein MK081_05255 [Flavobacteriales bacterium]|nr:hypothetical protein [Flavobacteriales bacterium]
MSARKLNLFTLTALFFAGMLLITSCGEGSGDAEGTNADQAVDQEAPAEIEFADLEGAQVTERKETIKKIFYTIPAPMEMASLIQSSGAAFDQDLLNSVDNVESYMTQKSKAINLGMYGADLSYTTMFERSKESLYYLSAVKQLADELGASNIIADELITRVETNKENKDSLMNIVSDTFWSLNAKFKEDGMEDISALVIAGGWIEALHLAGSHVEGNDELRQRIAEQQYSLDDLLKLINTYKNQDNLTDLKTDLESLASVFSEVEINKEKTETSNDDNGTMLIGGASTVTMSDETLAKVRSTVAEIRSKYIQ